MKTIFFFIAAMITYEASARQALEEHLACELSKCFKMLTLKVIS